MAIIYLRLPSADCALERVARRVAEGGHDIPEVVVRRRFARSWTNFLELYRKVADEWLVYDNTVRPPLLLEESGGWQGVREPAAGLIPGTFRETQNQVERHQDIGRTRMAGKPGRFPEGEPSVKSVFAALVRAQERAAIRASSVPASRASAEPIGDQSTPQAQIQDGKAPGAGQ